MKLTIIRYPLTIPDLLQEIIDKDIYKKDYEDITSKMLFEDAPYSTAIKTLQKIVDYKLF